MFYVLLYYLFFSKLENFCVGQHPYVANILRGKFTRPAKPRYTYTSWDVHVVAEHINKTDPNRSPCAKCLNWKRTTLFA